MRKTRELMRKKNENKLSYKSEQSQSQRRLCKEKLTT
jgi:hypothetical protein